MTKTRGTHSAGFNLSAGSRDYITTNVAEFYEQFHVCSTSCPETVSGVSQRNRSIMNMSWQCPRIDQASYGSGSGDPFLQSPVGHLRASAEMQQSMEQQHFLSSATTREQEELLRRKAEHMESLDIAPQHRYPTYTGRSNRFMIVTNGADK